MRVTVRFSPAKSLAARGMGGSTAARQRLCAMVRRRCDKYVPKDTGLLKNSAYETADGSAIVYPQPYAERQFYVNYRHSDPNRGCRWHQRMLSREAAALTRDLGAWMEGRKP